MQMVDAVRFRRVQDKIMVFVSSRIVECEEERTAVRDAILSINHQPVLFEHLGARPYPARELYLSRLRESQIMVAIYRSGYGYIDSANGMQISGLEDEYRFADEKKIRTLVYVYRSEVDRDEKLRSLIDDAGKRLTLSFYDRPEQLTSRVREDLTALITETCLDSISQSSALSETSAGLLARTELRTGVVVRRDVVVTELRSALETYGLVCLVGPAGIGKTTLAAQFAADGGAIFLRVTDLSPKEIYAVCATAIAEGRGATSGSASLESALDEFKQVWVDRKGVTLVLDECDFIDDVVRVVSEIESEGRNRILFTARVAPGSLHAVDVPLLSGTEAAEMLGAFAGGHQEALGLIGNPLLLQSAMAAQELGLQVVDFSKLTGTRGEIVRYLAIASVPLSAAELIEVVGSQSYAIDSLYADLEMLGRLIDDSPRGLQLMHASVAADILSSLQESPQRLAFYANRLTLLFDRQERPLHSYRVQKNLGDGSEEKYAVAAAREAARLGDWKVGLAIAEQALAKAMDQQSRWEAFHLLLGLIAPLELSGRRDRALELLNQAELLAPSLGGEAMEDLEETKLTLKARAGLSAADVEAVLELYKSYGEKGREWDRAKIGLELSVIYIGAKRFAEAVDVARSALEGFERTGDEFGIECAQRNLAVSLAATDGGHEEAESLIRLISERQSGEQDNRRQRAWYCNILTRRYRESGRYPEARAAATEAIDIASELGDESLRALNLVNLGNVYRDEKLPVEAKSAYEAAAAAARSCGRLDVDADASRLISGLYNDFEELGTRVHRHETAIHYAQYAIGLLRGTVYRSAAASAYVELSDALQHMSQPEQAAIALFRAARCALDDHDDGLAGSCMARAVRELLPNHANTYLSQLGEFGGVELPEVEDLENDLLETVDLVIKAAPRNALIAVLGRHLAALLEEMPSPSRSAACLKLVDRLAAEGLIQESWKALYAGLVFASLGGRSSSYYHHRISDAIAKLVPDVSFREEGSSRTWTVALELGSRVSVSIAPLDDSTDTAIASFALAVFFKAFEHEIRNEILGSDSEVSEVAFNVGRYDLMPDDLRKMSDELLDLGEVLTRQDCVASRATSFEEFMPTLVFLSDRFAGQAHIWSDEARLQALFAFSLVELVVQLQRGEVEMDVIRPKVVALVGRTLAHGRKLDMSE
jgi:tetratricopeptide (TPR) repeat protein